MININSINKLVITVLGLLVFSSSNFLFGQLLNEKTELKKQLSQLSRFPNNPCEIQNEVMLNCTNKIAHFIRFESCLEDKTKLKGIIFGVIVIDDTLYNISLETANTFFFNKETFLKDFKKLDKTAKTILENTNLQLNLDYYDNIREETRKMEEKKRLEQEEKIRVEKEKQRLEEERLAKIKAQKLADGLNKAYNDSLTNNELKFKIGQLNKLIKSQDSLVDLKIKTGINNGGILITQFSFSTSDYGVVDLTLGIQNVSKKRIKYVTFKLQPLNSVDDPVEYEKSFKGIGFIEPGTEGVWSFENAWFSDVIETLSLKNITLVYEDGSSKSVSKIGEIRIDDDETLLEQITNRQPRTPHQIESVILIEYKEPETPMVGFCIYSITSKDLTTEVFIEDDITLMKKNLIEILSMKKNNLSGKIGSFETTDYTAMIYFYLKDGYCLLSISNAEKMLAKLEELFPN